jgi:imidazolonepropionase-like amidohydrolase
VGRVLRIVATICLAFVVAAATASPPASRGGAFVIRNVRIFDGEKIIAADSVAVSDGKIVAVGRNVAAPPDAQIVDGTGDTLVPGLVDSHVHAWIRDVLKMDLVMGVTTDLDMYMLSQNIVPWRKQEAQGAPDAADFRTAGTAIAVAGGHGTVEPNLPKLVPLEGPEQAQAFVDERIAQGSDYIKVFYDNGPRFASMTKETLAAIVKAAHARHKMVIVHVFSAQGYLDVIDAGADGLAHVPIVKMPEPQFRDALRTHHVFAITTLGYTDFFFGRERVWSKLLDDPLIAPYLSQIARQNLMQPAYPNREHISYADNEANLRTLRDAGVPILAGTDANDAQSGALMHAELELMVKAGLTPTETLADATSVPARIFSLSDRGRIAPGMRADLLLVRGDPTKDIRATRDIVAIWKQGRRVDREGIREKLAQENEAWKFGAGWMPDTDKRGSAVNTHGHQRVHGTEHGAGLRLTGGNPASICGCELSSRDSTAQDRSGGSFRRERYQLLVARRWKDLLGSSFHAEHRRHAGAASLCRRQEMGEAHDAVFPLPYRWPRHHPGFLRRNRTRQVRFRIARCANRRPSNTLTCSRTREEIFNALNVRCQVERFEGLFGHARRIDVGGALELKLTAREGAAGRIPSEAM